MARQPRKESCEVAEGKSSRTPFLALNAVALIVGALAALLVGILFLLGGSCRYRAGKRPPSGYSPGFAVSSARRCPRNAASLSSLACFPGSLACFPGGQQARRSAPCAQRPG